MKNPNPVLFKEDSRFTQYQFSAPHGTYAPVYSWIWNAPVSREKTDRQLEEMRRMGIRAMYIIPEPKGFRPTTMPTLMEPEYLTKPYFEEYRYAMTRAKELGISLWLYDEGGWPSGGACGQVMLQHPELARKVLSRRSISAQKGETLQYSQDTAAIFDAEFRLLPDGACIEETCELTEYFVRAFFFDYPGAPEYPDILLKETTEAFIQQTHEGYREYLEELFGDAITAVFTDEPGSPRPVPFHQTIVDGFQTATGYSIIPFLPEICGDKPLTEAGAKAKIAFYDMCSKLYCTNFLLEEKRWSNEHHMAFVGHVDGDDVSSQGISHGSFHILRALRCFDVPGVDAIWRQIFPCDEPITYESLGKTVGTNLIFPRYASSAAAQIGSQRAITESMGVYGTGATFDEMRFLFNYQAIRGVNTFNLMSIPYGRFSFLRAGEGPLFCEESCVNPAALSKFNSYLERLSYISSLGKSVSDTALYMPVNDYWVQKDTAYFTQQFESIGKQLEFDRIVFDVIDDDILQEACPDALAKGKIVSGIACYRTVVVPPTEYMPAESIAPLEQFIRAGGKVYVVKGKNTPEISGACYVDTIKQVLTAPISITADVDKLTLGYRKAENADAFLIHNESLSKAHISVDLKDRNPGSVYILSLEDGEIIRPALCDGTLHHSLFCGELLCLLITDEALPYTEKPQYTEAVTLSGPFAFRKTKQLILTENSFENKRFDEPFAPTQLGDWTGTFGKAFSGSVLYQTRFAAPAATGSTVTLDLGDVRYTCAVSLNGEPLGVRINKPYRYEIPAEKLLQENLLEIEVSNTPGNEYTHTHVFDKWQRWQIPGYWDIGKVFQEDTLSSGLFGPVTLQY